MRANRKVIHLVVRHGRMETPDEIVNLIRFEMYGMHVKDLAEDCNVSTGCIYAIRSGRTRWPRGQTLFAILTALGYEIHVKRAE